MGGRVPDASIPLISLLSLGIKPTNVRQTEVGLLRDSLLVVWDRGRLYLLQTTNVCT